ncbi:methyl-accepting chemotaxis protein [Priestia endophytica]|uniref:methyl-accepting chemotaxis protein n=1 Tax=Priestia endophytica TaxID=135735 RepID=UPI00124D381E|nr:methyl-accepting chemotaxis protein [Priestia endophytica]KAB2493589.1 methyl-accepting chemotaxis protein [Priestia endophytica]
MNSKEVGSFKSFWRSVPISKKFYSIFLMMFCFMIVSIFIAMFFLNTTLQTFQSAKEKNERAVHITEIGSLIRSKDINIADYITFLKEEDLKLYRSHREELHKLMNLIQEDVNVSNEMKHLFSKVKENNEKIDRLFIFEISPAVVRLDKEIYTSAREEISSLRDENLRLLKELRTFTTKESMEAYKEAEGSITISILGLLISTAATFLCGSIVLFFLVRFINYHLQKVVGLAKKIAEGDLSVEKMFYDGNDEIGVLIHSSNQMAENLRTVVTSIHDVSKNIHYESDRLLTSTQEVRSGSEEISATIQDLSDGANIQASSAARVMETMQAFSEEMDSATKEVEHLVLAFRYIRDITNKGNKSMEDSVQEMTSIYNIVQHCYKEIQSLDKSSEQITQLTDFIKEIAEQTNLLALNAAIEAARAGEYGKGFSVVAEEVRKLSQQVESALGDITGITTGIQTKAKDVLQGLEFGYETVEKGTTLIEATGQGFQHINERMEKVITNIEKISGSIYHLKEQNVHVKSTFDQVALSSDRMTNRTSQTLQSVQVQDSEIETILKRIENLSNNADDLAFLVEKFNLRKDKKEE